MSPLCMSDILLVYFSACLCCLHTCAKSSCLASLRLLFGQCRHCNKCIGLYLFCHSHPCYHECLEGTFNYAQRTAWYSYTTWMDAASVHVKMQAFHHASRDMFLVACFSSHESAVSCKLLLPSRPMSAASSYAFDVYTSGAASTCQTL